MSAAELTVVASPPRARLSTRFLRSELKIIFGRRRNLAGLAVLAAVPVILAIAVRVSSPGQGDGPNFITAIAGNGLFVAFAALALELPLFLPLAISAISGDSVAGEANLGTLRYLLAIPAGRTRLLVIKYAAIVIFAVVATLLVATVGTIMVRVKDSREGRPPALPRVNGLAPGCGAGHCQSVPTNEPTPSPVNSRARARPTAGTSSGHSPVMIMRASLAPRFLRDVRIQLSWRSTGF